MDLNPNSQKKPETTISALTILFEAPFWVGIYERNYGSTYQVCKITFGSEPKDYEIYDFILTKYTSLKFSDPINIELKNKKSINPKRMQRDISSLIKKRGIGTKAQNALKLQHEENAAKRKKLASERKRVRQDLKFEQKRQKKKEKHKGK